MVARTAQDVANMESELDELRGMVAELQHLLTVSDTERKSLQVQNVLLQRQALDNHEKAVRMETIMSQVSSGLVAGLKEMKEEREVARAVRRQVQEHNLEVGRTAAPEFLRAGARTPDNSRVVLDSVDPSVQPEARREPDQDREDRLRGAAERVAPPLTPRPRPGQANYFDPTLADRDNRIPRNVHGGLVENDDDNLLRLAGNMDQRTR